MRLICERFFYALQHLLIVFLYREAVLLAGADDHRMLDARILAVKEIDIGHIDDSGGVLIDIGETDETLHGSHFYMICYIIYYTTSPSYPHPIS